MTDWQRPTDQAMWRFIWHRVLRRHNPEPVFSQAVPWYWRCSCGGRWEW